MENINKIRKEFLYDITKIQDKNSLIELKNKYLSKKGVISSLMKELTSLSDEEKKTFGAVVNELKKEAAELVDKKFIEFETKELEDKLQKEKVDITLPIYNIESGKIHPITKVIEEITVIFASLGFKVAWGPDIEDDYHNFTALNIDENHPARQMHDTFYLPKSNAKTMLLRTHTSSVQIRTMKNSNPPYKLISYGRTFRCDSDVTHTPMFHQVEGLVIDHKSNLANLKDCLQQFLKLFFEVDEVPIRMRASFFPFTEPSAEVDVRCNRSGKEIKIGEGQDWLEILGCGMVHENVLRSVGLDPDQYQGYAFGMGIERLAMLKYGISDLRTFFQGDLRWLKHYGFSIFNEASIAGGLRA